MTAVAQDPKVSLKNVLLLTDFSEPSEAALPYALAIARGYGARVHALHVFMPTAHVNTPPELTIQLIELEEENAKALMRGLDSELAGVEHETIVERGIEIWPAAEQVIKEQAIDLVVAGTHGRTGVKKLLLGSVAEEIFRRSPVPVLTIGPQAHGNVHNAGRFHRVLFATDFTPASTAALPFAVSLATENHARLVVLHVIPKRQSRDSEGDDRNDLSVAETFHRIHDAIPHEAGMSSPPEAVIEFGEPAERIIAAAQKRRADVIVLGVRAATGHIGSAIHLERATAHKVVARATCPVLTVRHQERGSWQ